MSKDLNINNLFPSSQAEKGTLCISNLFTTLKPQSNIPKIKDLTDIIQAEQERKQQLAIVYRKMLNECIELFKNHKKYNDLDMVYEIRQFYRQIYIPEISNCRDYIMKKLFEIGLDTYPISDRFIFITWINLDNNLKKISKKEKKEKKKKKKKK